MQKKNTGLKVLVAILMFLILGLAGYIVYEKTLKEETITNQIDNTTTENTQTEEIEINYKKIISETKDKFEFVFNYANSIFAYCGEHTISERVAAHGNHYNVSTQFTTYEEMYNYLKTYMSEEVIKSSSKYEITKENYLEENGNLYCETFGKGSPYNYGDSIIEIENIDNNKITATAIKELIDPSGIITNKKIKITLEKINDIYIITSYDIQN